LSAPEPGSPAAQEQLKDLQRERERELLRERELGLLQDQGRERLGSEHQQGQERPREPDREQGLAQAHQLREREEQLRERRQARR
jgi:hypothetical protein